MVRERFFMHPDIPHAEVRCSRESERRYRPHIHSTYCIGAIDEGEVAYRVGGRVEALRKGSLAVIGPEVLHSCNPADSRGRSYYALFLDAEWCERLRRSLFRCESPGPVESVLLEGGSLFRRFVELLESLMRTGDSAGKGRALADLAGEIFLRAGRSLGEDEHRLERVGLIKSRLSAGLDESVSLRQLALDLGENPYTLLRRFKAATGMTPHAYRLNRRIEQARRLLREGWEPARAALECGFFDQSHLHRHFRAIAAATPGEYRVNFVQ
jgi:AraC-like DNA-binding protein